MAGRNLIRRRVIGSALLAVFVALTVQAGFFHSCQSTGPETDAMVAGGHGHLHHNGHTSVCAACLLTRILAAAEPGHAPEPAISSASEDIEGAPDRATTASSVADVTARAPPGC